MDEKTLDDIIREIVTTIRPYGNLDFKAKQFLSMYDKYRNAWEEFKEYHTHVRSVLLERFMI